MDGEPSLSGESRKKDAWERGVWEGYVERLAERERVRGVLFGERLRAEVGVEDDEEWMRLAGAVRGAE